MYIIMQVTALTQIAFLQRCMHCPTTYLPELCVSSCDPTASVPYVLLLAPV